MAPGGTEHSSVSSPALFTGAIQKVSQPSLGKWHQWQWQTACSSLSLISITHLCSFLFPWCFPAAVPPFTWPKRFPHSSPFCPGTRMCALTWFLWLGSAQGGFSWPLSAGNWGSKAYWDPLLLLSNFQSVPKPTGFLFKSFLGTASSKEWDKQENNSKGNVQPNHYRTTYHRLLRSICLTAHCTSSVEVTHM